MIFDLLNYLLKIQESIEIPNPKVRAHFGVCGFIPSHMNVTFEFHFWCAPLQALALVMSPRLKLGHV